MLHTGLGQRKDVNNENNSNSNIEFIQYLYIKSSKAFMSDGSLSLSASL